MKETGTNGAAPVIGITMAFDDGTHEESLRPGVAIHQVSAAYAWAVEHAGAAPVLLPLTASEEVARAYVRMVDGIMFSGGGGAVRRRHLDRAVLPDLRALAPRRYRFEAMLLRLALEEDVPVLGICRGHQMIVRVLGGTIYSRIDRHVPEALNHYAGQPPLGRAVVHSIAVEPGTMLHDILGKRTVGVNSLHRQAAKRVPAPLIVSARAPDGVIEAVESTAHRFVVGIQSHPELIASTVPAWRRLFEAFVAAARERRRAAGERVPGRDAEAGELRSGAQERALRPGT